MVVVGLSFVNFGICIARTTTTTASMAALVGFGVNSAALVCIDIASGPCFETSKAIGGKSGHIGTAGNVIISIVQTNGVGAVSVVLVVIGTGCESCCAGTVHVGDAFVPTGTCSVRIITITSYMDVLVGSGVTTSELACTVIDYAPCGVTCRESGAVCGHIGTCGSATIIIVQTDGAGVANAV